MFPSLLLTVRMFSQHAKSSLISKMLLKPLIQCEDFILIYTSLVKQFYASPQAFREHCSAYVLSYIFISNRCCHMLAHWAIIWEDGFFSKILSVKGYVHPASGS